MQQHKTLNAAEHQSSTQYEKKTKAGCIFKILPSNGIQMAIK